MTAGRSRARRQDRYLGEWEPTEKYLGASTNTTTAYLGGQLLAASASSYNKIAAKGEKRKMKGPQEALWTQKP